MSWNWSRQRKFNHECFKIQWHSAVAFLKIPWRLKQTKLIVFYLGFAHQQDESNELETTMQRSSDMKCYLVDIKMHQHSTETICHLQIHTHHRNNNVSMQTWKCTRMCGLLVLEDSNPQLFLPCYLEGG